MKKKIKKVLVALVVIGLLFAVYMYTPIGAMIGNLTGLGNKVSDSSGAQYVIGSDGVATVNGKFILKDGKSIKREGNGSVTILLTDGQKWNSLGGWS